MLWDAWWHEITPALLNSQSSVLHVHFLYGFVLLQSWVDFICKITKVGTAQQIKLSRFSCIKLPSSYSVSDFLLHLTHKSKESTSWAQHLLHLPLPLSYTGGSPALFKWSSEHKLSSCITKWKISQLFPLGTFSFLCCSDVLCCLTVATYELSFIISLSLLIQEGFLFI